MASDNFRENLQPCCIAVEGFPAETNEGQVRLVFKNCLKAESIAGAQIQRTKWLILFHSGADVDTWLKTGTVQQRNCTLEISPCIPCDIPTSWEKVDLQSLGPPVVPGDTTQQKGNFEQQHYGQNPGYPGYPGYQPHPGYIQYPAGYGPYPGHQGNVPQGYNQGYPQQYGGQQGPNPMGPGQVPTVTENVIYPKVSTPGPPGGPPPQEHVQGREGQSPGMGGEGEGQHHPKQDGYQPPSPEKQPQAPDVKLDEKGRQTEGSPLPDYSSQPHHDPGTQPHPSDGSKDSDERGRPAERYPSMPAYYRQPYPGPMQGPDGMYSMPQYPGHFAPRFPGPYPQGRPPPYSPYPRMHPGHSGSPRMTNPYQYNPNQPPTPSAPDASVGSSGKFENEATAAEAGSEEEEEEEEEESEQLGMIKVTELSPKITEDTLTYFFENRKKSGGGEIEEIDFQKDSAAAIITFKDPAVVDRVLQKLPLLLEKKQIKVERFVPESYNSGAMGKDGNEEETSDTKPSCTIEVRGMKEDTSRDTIELYFESKKAAGQPSDIMKLDDSERGEGVIYVTYETEEVVRAVVEREHKLEGAKLEVKQYIPPPPPKPRPLYPDKVLIKGKNPDTTQDGLENFLEAKANVTPIDFLPGEEEDTVLVTFEEPPDFEKLELACKKKALDKHFLKVFRVPISNCIIVKGVGDKTSPNTLEFYFENTRRSGGGDVTEVKEHEDGSYLVYFEDHTVIDSVCKRTHTLDKHTLDVKLYHELIGDCGEDGPKFKVPDVLIITDLDPRKIQFLKTSKPNKDGLEKQLTTQHTKIIWPEKLADPVKLECLLTKDVQDCRNLAKTWKQTARTSLDKFLDVLLVVKHEILQDAWDGVLAKLQDMNISHPDGVTVAVEKVSFEIFVMGHKKFATDVSQCVKKFIDEIADELDRKKKQVKETTSPMKHHQVIILSHTHFTDTVEKKYPGLKVKLDFKARTVTYEGLYGEVTSAKLEMYEIINAMTSSDVGDFNKGRYAYLQDKAVKQYVAGKMKEENIMSVWEMQDSRFVVYAMTDDDAVRAAHILKESILETIVHVKKESSPLLSSDRWLSEERSIKDACSVMVQMKVQLDKPCIVIYSTDRDAGMVRERVTDFLTMNTIYNTKLAISTGMLRFLQDHCANEIRAISDRHKADQVTIDIDNMGLEIKGTEVGLSKAKMDIGAVIDSVESKKHILKKPGITKLMTSEDSKPKVSQVEKSHGVVIVPSDESEDDVSGGGAGGRPSSPPRRRDGIQEMARCSQSNYHLMVMLGDITNLKVDVLVNAANKELQHGGGLAKAIVDKGGITIQRDCNEYIKRHSKLLEGDVYLGEPGNLKCNFIAHAVGPVWQGGHSGEEDMLHEAVLKSMEEANNKNQTSIALPALGAGVFGYPANKSTKTIVQAVDDFYGDNPGCCIRDVYLCDVNQKNVDLFIKALQRQFGTGNVIVLGHGGGARDKWSKPQAKPRKGWNTAVPDVAPSFSEGPIETNISIKLVKGQIAKQKVDIIVNTCSKDLKLSNGAVSSSLLSAAGMQMQTECDQNYQGITFGDIAVTSGYSLKCQEVCHGALPGWDGGATSLAVLQKFMLACLQQATTNGFQSVAFPAMGTGNLNYPRDLVAKEMFKIVTNYSIQNPSSSLKEVRFVIYDKDAPTVKAFETAEKSRGSSSHARGPSSRHSRHLGDPNQQDGGHRHGNHHYQGNAMLSPSASTDEYEEVSLNLGTITLKVYQGDITQAKTDAIVNGTNAEFDLKRGHVSSAILKSGGPNLEKQVRSYAKKMKQTGIAVTTSDPKVSGMPCNMIIHINAEDTKYNWKEKYLRAMSEADSRQCTSVAFPALGTALQGNSVSDIARSFVDATVEFMDSNPVCVTTVHMVIFQQSMFNTFLSTMKTAFENQQNKPTSWKQRMSNMLFGSSNNPRFSWNPSIRKVSLDKSCYPITVYGKRQDTISDAIDQLEKLLWKNFTEKTFEDRIIKDFTKAQERQIVEMEEKFNIEAKVDIRLGRIRLLGLLECITDAADYIHKMIRQTEQAKQLEQEAKLIGDMVQWNFIEITADGEKLIPYPPHINRQLEKGYKDKKTEVKFPDNEGNQYVIDLNSLTEYLEDQPSDTVKVIRKCKIEDSSFEPPSDWSPMADKDNVSVVQVPTSDPAYASVTQNFQVSLGGGKTIIKIERIQNRTLYQQYIAKKKLMDAQNPAGTQNERTLWHGTAPETVASVNTHGFNRSYCGKNATVYGDGVYFAVNSSYSASTTYSRPDPSGHQRMYQCKVLTGEFTQGSNGLRVPPAKGAAGSHILYDSVVDKPRNPGMFIIFNDTQAYPEYLITFQ